MPIYEYKCAECGHVTEFLESAEGEAEHCCEECGSADVKREFSAFSARMAPAARPASSCDTCPSSACPMRK